jgi:CrcB protein
MPTKVTPGSGQKAILPRRGQVCCGTATRWPEFSWRGLAPGARACGAAGTIWAMLSVLAISIGAALGALSRWGLALWLSPGGAIAWGTLAANLLGGYLVGVCVAVFQSMPQLDPLWRLLLVTGCLGGLTTFSTFSAEVVAYLLAERYALAAGVALLHVAGSLVLTVAGIRSALFFIAARAG